MKTCLAIVSALCAFAAVATSAAPHDQQVAVAGMPEAILGILSNVLTKIESVNNQWEINVKSKVENELENVLDAVKDLDDTVEALEQKAQDAGIDVSDCTNTENLLLKDIISIYFAESKECMEKNDNGDKEETLQAIMDITVAAQSLIQDAKDKVTACLQQGNSLTHSICVARNLIPMSIKTGSLAIKAVSLRLRSSGTASSVIASAKSCGAEAFKNNLGEIQAIFKQAEVCIQNKLPN